ncbi:MAG TPA: hypothetical protein VM261_14980 [Kofleriaceae bacterium]|nr:hypothetical protein [Kofleriaceae bacterium]
MGVALAVVALHGCDSGGMLGDPCAVEDDCAENYSCVQCSVQSACYFEDALEDAADYEYVCRQFGAGAVTDPRAGGGGGGGNCASSWTCEYDGQATPMCQAACIRTGSEREQTCRVLACFMESGDSGECCSVCTARCE